MWNWYYVGVKANGKTYEMLNTDNSNTAISFEIALNQLKNIGLLKVDEVFVTVKDSPNSFV